MNAEPTLHDAAARVLALVLAGRGWIDDCELEALDRIDAFRSLGIDRDRFIDLTREYGREIGSHLGETSWLRNTDRVCVDDLLHRVDPEERLLVCRLAAAAMAASGCGWNEEHMLYAYMLASWEIRIPDPAIQSPHGPAPGGGPVHEAH